MWHADYNPIVHDCICAIFQYCATILHPTAPGPVSELRYEENTNTSVNVTWKPPKEPNGDILAYFVVYGVYRNKSTIKVTIDARRPLITVVQALGKSLCFLHKATIIFLCQPHSVPPFYYLSYPGAFHEPNNMS